MRDPQLEGGELKWRVWIDVVVEYGHQGQQTENGTRIETRYDTIVETITVS